MSWITAYKATIRQLPTLSLFGEIQKLENSIKHLQRSNDELKTHAERESDSSWVGAIVSENEDVIAKQKEQIEITKAEIKERCGGSEHAEDKPVTCREESNISSVAGPENGQRRQENRSGELTEPLQMDHGEDGMYL